MKVSPFHGDVEVAAPPSTETVGSATVSQQISQRMEAALKQRTSHASSSTITSHISPSQKVLSNGIDTKTTVESVVPSLGYLRGNETVQAEVEKTLAELAQINETATKGRLKSQREGSGDITIKIIVDWPQNFILTGSRKTRPSYDDLTMAQWVSGFVRCVQEEKSEAARCSMLDYLFNLMEGASDFSWESAKAAHAIVLTNMEADRLRWTETN